MGKTTINKQLGTKWFTFYTKIHPWFVCLFTLPIITDFMEYIDFYTGYWWSIFYVVANVVRPVLRMIVFGKSLDMTRDYAKFVTFVKFTLIYEVLNFAYTIACNVYIMEGAEEGFSGTVCLVFLLVVFVAYFAWFELNARYFEKRIRYIELEEETNVIPQKNVMVEKAYESKGAHAISFCRKCGAKIPKYSRFCGQCGTEIIE